MHFTHVNGGGGLAHGDGLVEVDVGAVGAGGFVDVGAGGGVDEVPDDVGPGDVVDALEGQGAGVEADVSGVEVPLDEEDDDAPSHVQPSWATHCHCSARSVQSRAEPLQYSPLLFQLHPRCPSQRVRPE